MNDEIGHVLYEVAFVTAVEMGDELTNMSCFVSKWVNETVPNEEQSEEFELA